MPTKTNPDDISKLIQRKDLHVDLQLKTTEETDEKALRLHKERMSFYIKDAGTYTFGLLFLVATVAYCFWVLVSKSASAVEKQQAWTAVWAVLGGVVGLFFGRATK